MMLGGLRGTSGVVRGIEKRDLNHSWPNAGSFAAAVFVFLAAAAGAGVVAADLGAGADGPVFFFLLRRRRFADDVSAVGRRSRTGTGGGRSAKGAGGLVQGLLGHVAQKIFEGGHGGRAAEDVVADLRFDIDHQFVEHAERLGLVFHQGVALAIAAQADAVTETVHFIKVFLPEAVNGHQNGEALDFFEGFGIFEADFDVVRLANVFGDEAGDGILRRRQAVEKRSFHGFFRAGLGGLEDFPFRQAQRKVQIYPVGQLPDLPVVKVRFGGGELRDFFDDNFLHEVHEFVAHVFGVNDFVAEAVDDFTLLVHHIVVFERAFADLEVVLLDFFLGAFDGAVQPGMGQFIALLEAHFLHPLADAVRAEEAHQVVFERNEKVRRAGVALAGAATAQLAVNAPRFVAFGAQDVQATQLGHAGAEFDVGAATGHVGGAGDGAALAGTGDDFGLLLVILGVEDGVDQAFTLEHAREHFAGLDGDGADENGAPLRVQLFDFPDNGVEFFAFGAIDRVVGVFADAGFVGGDGQHAEFVDVVKLGGLGFRRAGHAGELGVKAEVILNGDGGQRLGFALDGHAFLGLNGLVQPVAPAAAGHEPAGVLVHDDDLVVLHDVFDIPLVERIGLEQLRDGVNFLGFGLEFLLQPGLGFHPLARVGFRAGVNIVQGGG